MRTAARILGQHRRSLTVPASGTVAAARDFILEVRDAMVRHHDGQAAR